MRTQPVVPMSAQDLKERHFESWLEDTEPEWFLEYLSPTREARARHLMSRFECALSRPEGRVFLRIEGEQIIGAIALERMPWDSVHFGIECGRVVALCVAKGFSGEQQKTLYADLFNRAKEWAKENRIRLLQRRVLFNRTEEREYLYDNDFQQVDYMVTMWRSLARGFPLTEIDRRIRFRSADVNDLPTLLAMTGGAFPNSRFVRDPTLRQACGEEVYQRWIENLLRNESSDKTPAGARTNVSVCIVGENVVGYAAYRTDPTLDKLLERQLGMLDLIVVDKTHRGQGIGGSLLIHTIETMRNRGMSDVEATTWVDADVLAFYRRAGLREKAELSTFHLWMN